MLKGLLNLDVPTAPVAAADALDWLGVAGFVLSIVGLVWQIWTYHTEHRVRLGAEASMVDQVGAYLTIVVRVWNRGRVPAYITSVSIAFPPDDTAEGPAAGADTRVEHRGEEFILQPVDHDLRAIAVAPEEALQPGAQRTYGLQKLTAKGLASLGRNSLDRSALIIRTPEGDALTVEGWKIAGVVGAVAARYRDKEGARN